MAATSVVRYLNDSITTARHSTSSMFLRISIVFCGRPVTNQLLFIPDSAKITRVFVAKTLHVVLIVAKVGNLDTRIQ